MKKNIFVGIFLIMLTLGVGFCTNDNAPSIGEIKAYPNPFVPGSQTLIIKPSSGNFDDGSTVVVHVLDYNQNEVFKKEFSVSTTDPEVKWSGYMENGKRLPTGVYTIFLNITLPKNKDYQSRTGETRIIVE